MLVTPDFCHDREYASFTKIKDIRFVPTAGTNIYNSVSLKNTLDDTGEASISTAAWVVEVEGTDITKLGALDGST